MSYEALAEEIKTLPESYLAEINDFVIYLKLKTKFGDYENSSNSRQSRLAALSEFAGSMKKSWQSVDALEYQNAMRGERSIG